MFRGCIKFYICLRFDECIVSVADIFLRHEKLQQQGEETVVGWNTVILDHHVGMLLIIGYAEMTAIIC